MPSPAPRCARRSRADLACIDTGCSPGTWIRSTGIPVYLLRVRRVPAAGDAREAGRDGRALARDGRLHRRAHRDACGGASPDGLVACRAPVERVADILAELLATPGRGLAVPGPARRATGDRGHAEHDAGAADGWTTAERERFAADLRDRRRRRDPPGVRPPPRRPRRPRSARPPARRSGPACATSPAATTATGAWSGSTPRSTSTPDELHRTGLAEIERIDAELAELAGRTIGTRSLRRGPRRASAATPPSTSRPARRSSPRPWPRSRARPRRSPTGSAASRRRPCEVVRMAAHEEEHIDHRLLPPAGGGRLAARPVLPQHRRTPRPGRATRRRSSPTTSPSPATTSRSRSRQELAGLPAFRRHLGPTAFFEGWGLYTERLRDEMGLYTGDLDRIGVLSLRRLAGLAARRGHGHARDGLDARGRRSTSCSSTPPSRRNNIANEVDRYIVDARARRSPTRPGQLELLRLRAEARERLGRRLRHPRLPRHGARERGDPA